MPTPGKSVLGPLLAMVALVGSFLLVVPAFLQYGGRNESGLKAATLLWGAASIAIIVWIARRLKTGTARSKDAHIAVLTLQSLITAGFCGLGLLTFALAKYEHRRTSREARQNVGAMYRGAVAYFEAEHTFKDGKLKPKQFPASVGPTPPEPFCKGGERFTPKARDWDHPSWQALSFAIGDPHHYKYELVSRGTGTSAGFTARALGDLDCDGTYSTFERTASVNAAGEVVGGSGIYVDNELE